MIFNNMTELVVRKLFSLISKGRRNARKAAAVILCVSLVAGNMPVNYITALAAENDSDDADYVYEIESISFAKAVRKAVSDGDYLENEIKFLGEASETYDELFSPDGTLYELDWESFEIEKDKDREKNLKLRVFARITKDIPLDETYEIDGEEDILFLLQNKTDDEVSVSINVDGRESEIISIPAAGDIEVSFDSDSDIDDEDVTDLEDEDNDDDAMGPHDDDEGGRGFAGGRNNGNGSSGGRGGNAAAKGDQTEAAGEDKDSDVKDDKGSDKTGNEPGDRTGKVTDKEFDNKAEEGKEKYKNSASEGRNEEAGKENNKPDDNKSDPGKTGGNRDTYDNGSDNKESNSNNTNGKGSDSKESGGKDSGNNSTERSGGSSNRSNDSKDSDKGSSTSGSGSSDDKGKDDKQSKGEKTASLSVHSGNLLTAAIASDSDAEKASPSDASKTIEGTTYDPVRIGRRGAVAFVTNAENLGLAEVDLSGIVSDAEIYSMSLDALCDAVEYEVTEGEPLKEDEEGCLYEISPELKEEAEGLTLRTFVKINNTVEKSEDNETTDSENEGYADLAYSERESIEPIYEEELEEGDYFEEDPGLTIYRNRETGEVKHTISVEPDVSYDQEDPLNTAVSTTANTAAYHVTGEEEIYFLLTNETDEALTARIQISTSDEIYETERLIIPGNGMEAYSSTDAESYFDGADTDDGCNAMEGTVYEEVTDDGEPEIVYVITLENLGISYGIMLLDGETAEVSSQEELEAALENENITYIKLINDIDHYCSSDTSYMYVVNRDGITVDLNGHTIKIVNEASNWWAGTMFQVSADNFTLKNGIIDGSRNDVAFYDCYGIWAKTENINMTLEDLTIQDLIMQPVYFRSDGGSVTITNCNISHNANTYNVDGDGACGAGLNIQGCDSVTITNSTISDNDTYTNDQINGQSKSGDGGGIYLLNVSDVEISNCTFEGNKAKHTGGAMAIWNCGDITIEDCIVDSNTGKGYGGGIAIYNDAAYPVGDVRIINNKITKNTCEKSDYGPSVSGYKPAYGGGIAVIDMATERDDNVECIFSGNTVTGNSVPNTSSYYCGGGISLTGMSDGITFRILSGTISENTGAMGGGLDISQNGDSSVILYNTIVTDNTAGQQGGGIWVCPHSKTTVNVTFGGAIYGNTVPNDNRNPSFGGPEGDDIYFEGRTASSTGIFVKVASRALGGVLMDWYADDKNARYEDGVSEPVDVTDPNGRYRNAEEEFGLHGNLSEKGIALAKAEATLWITDNIANVAGGGIYSNREVDFGEGTDLTVTAKKVWLDHEGNPLAADVYKDFSVDITLVRVDEDGNGVDLETVTLNSENSWTWNFKDLPTRYMDDYGEEHSYTYTAAESNAVSDGSFEVTVKSGEVTGDDDGGYKQEITVTNKQVEPKLTKEEFEDDYKRKDEDIEHDDSNGEFEENIEGDGWGSWDDADNNQEINYRMNLTHVKDIHEMTIHDYLEDGLDFEPDTVNIILYNGAEDSGRVLSRAAGDDPDSGEYDYYVTQGECSDTEGREMEWMPGCTFEVHFSEFLFDPEDEDPSAEPLDDEAHVVITYNALTHTHADDYFDDEHTYEDVILNDAYVEGTFGLTMMSFRALPVSTETELFGFGVYKYYTDEAGERQPLAGAKFVLYETGERTDGTTGVRYATFETEKDEEGNEYYLTSGWVDDIEEATKMISGADGYIRIEGLDDDTYYLTETDAPEGYQKLSGDITVIINEDDAITANGSNVSTDNEFPHEISVGNDPNSINGVKIWDDNNNAAGRRPESITIHLYAGTTEISSVTVTEADNWEWEFTNLPKYDENGEEIIYTIAEDQVEDYTTEYDHDVDSDSYTVINKYTPGKIGVTVEKEWVDSDNSNPIHPEITVELLRNGEGTGLTCILNESNDWFGSFDDLEEYDSEGGKYVYTIKELNVAGDYKAETDHLGETNVFVITNTYSPNKTNEIGDLTIHKEVTNGGSTTDDFDFTLELTGGVAGESYEVIDGNNAHLGWITFDENGNASYEFTLKHGESITVKDLPEGIEYTITETDSNGYKVTINGVTTVDGSSGSGEISSDGVNVTFTNSRGSTTTTTHHGSSGGGGGSSSGSSGSTTGGPGTSDGGPEGEDDMWDLQPLPPTGESNKMVFGITALAVSAMALVILLWYRRRSACKE